MAEADGRCGAGRRFALYAYCAQVAAAAMFFLIAGVSSLPLWLAWKLTGISARDGQRVLRVLFRIHIWWMRATGMLRLEVRGFEALRDMRGTIIVSNHPALLDVEFLVGNLPPTACVMRADLLRNPFLGGCALAAGYVTNDSGPGFVRQGIEKVRSGENLLVFPEGTRTLTRPVNRFKNGFALVAARAGAPVRTVVIEYSGRHLTKGVSLFTPTEVPLRFTIRAGELFHANAGESAPEFSRRIEAWFRGQLERPVG
jgi:1-acyl-sn-glycerol-3-phosphate acyltransferase